MGESSWRAGDSKTGFEVVAEANIRVVHLRMWGYWDDALGEQYREAVTAAFGLIPPGARWHVLADISSYPPQRPSVQRVHADMMALGKTAGIVRSANLVSSTLGQMQIRRLSEESGLPEYSFFQNRQDAMAWLLSDG